MAKTPAQNNCTRLIQPYKAANVLAKINPSTNIVIGPFLSRAKTERS